MDDNPNDWERGLIRLTTTPQARHDPLLATLPDTFEAWLSHRQSVITPPAHAKVLAVSEKDGCQILRYSSCALSVQFHPEFDRRIMDACLPEACERDGEELQGADWARSVLYHFWLQTRPAVNSAQGA